MGKCCLGYVFALTPLSLRGQCHIFLWASKLTRKLVESSLGGEAYAFAETLDRAPALRAFCDHFIDTTPGVAGLADCESLFTHLKNKKPIAEMFLV